MAVKRPGKNAAYVACNGGCRATADCQYGCVGCERCVRECPRGVIRLHERLNPILVRCANENTGKEARAMCSVSCIGCGVCERACPSGAIRVENNLARLDDGLCLSCGQCLVKCPRGVITDQRGILHK